MRFIPLPYSQKGIEGVTIEVPAGGLNFGGLTPDIATPGSFLGIAPTGASFAGFSDFETWLGTSVAVSHVRIRDEFSDALSANVVEAYSSVAGRVKLSAIWDLAAGGPATPDFVGIANGDHDANLNLLADKFVLAGYGDSNLILRLWHESDLSGQFHTFRNGNEADWIAAWQHIHTLFEAKGSFLWQYSMGSSGGGDLAIVDLGYPGDAFVTSIGIGNYDRASFRRCVFGFTPAEEKLDRIQGFAVTHNLAFDVPEWGLWLDGVNGRDGCDDDPPWIQDNYDYFAALPATGPGRRGFILYFNNSSGAQMWDFAGDLSADGNFPMSKALFNTLFGP